MRWNVKAWLVILFCVVNTSWVLIYAQGKFGFLSWLVFDDKSAHSEPTNEIGEDNIELVDTATPGPKPNSQSNNSEAKPHDLPILGNRCFDKRKSPNTKKLYTWQSADGTRHISDKPRAVDPSVVVKVVAEIPPELISLNFKGLGDHIHVRPEISDRINSSLKLYQEVVPAHLVKPIIVDLHLFWNEADYQRYRQQVAPQSTYSQGFYRANTNESVVWARTEKQAVSTSVHEAMHSVNRHWIGEMSRWLNEGIAELSELIPIESKQLRNQLLGKQFLPLDRLINSGREQWIGDRAVLEYRTAMAFIGYLYFQDRDALSRLILAEAENGCGTLDIKDVERITGKTIQQLNWQLQKWVVL